MLDPASLSTAELRSHLKQVLDSLRAAGVQWLPVTGPAAAPAAAGQPPASADEPAVSAGGQLRPKLEASVVPVAVSSPFVPRSSDSGVIPPPQERGRELLVLAERVASCTRCPQLAKQRTQTVFGVGPVDPELCFIGEAPGFSEDKQGEPFVGDAGQLLNRMIAACGMKREEVYICNIVKCRPPNNRLPLPDEAAHCREYLLRQLELVQPRFICCLGACAAQNLLQSSLSVGRLRGRFHEYTGIPVLCTYHPAYLLRTPEKKKDVWEDLKMLLAKMGRVVPPK